MKGKGIIIVLTIFIIFILILLRFRKEFIVWVHYFPSIVLIYTTFLEGTLKILNIIINYPKYFHPVPLPPEPGMPGSRTP